MLWFWEGQVTGLQLGGLFLWLLGPVGSAGGLLAAWGWEEAPLRRAALEEGRPLYSGHLTRTLSGIWTNPECCSGAEGE